ncbi:hypothetical protein Hanom_Chr06g00519311 [Helianthus anomalus]
MITSPLTLLHTTTIFILTKVLHTHLRMNSLNIIVDFSTHMYFRKLNGSGTVWNVFRCTGHEVIRV